MAFYYNVMPPAIRQGDRIVYDHLGEERTGVIVDRCWNKSNRIVVLDNNEWCYESSVKRVIFPEGV